MSDEVREVSEGASQGGIREGELGEGGERKYIG